MRDNKRYSDKRKQAKSQNDRELDEQEVGRENITDTDSSNRDAGESPVSATDKTEVPLRSKKLLLAFGGITLALGVLGFVFSGGSSVDTSEAAENALNKQVSAELSAGAILLSDDEELTAQDHTVAHSSAEEETKIWVWDYAAEDGDYVQVLINGTPVSESFMIKHKPKEFTIPAVGTVEIKGIKDGGGGITYAVRYDVNGTNYFNTAPLNGENKYELVRE
ncbi:hypothetical protein SFC66_04300 [Terribacillus saccharophilus]|uniref:hypothetical protein n=1 Tax=Terribacillus saccharophilus TaxID=361277 RepID=UPI00398198EB